MWRNEVSLLVRDHVITAAPRDEPSLPFCSPPPSPPLPRPPFPSFPVDHFHRPRRRLASGGEERRYDIAKVWPRNYPALRPDVASPCVSCCCETARGNYVWLHLPFALHDLARRIGKFREFNYLLARLLNPLHTGASAVCSLAVAPHLTVMGFAKVFPCKSTIDSEAGRTGLINCDPIYCEGEFTIHHVTRARTARHAQTLAIRQPGSRHEHAGRQQSQEESVHNNAEPTRQEGVFVWRQHAANQQLSAFTSKTWPLHVAFLVKSQGTVADCIHEMLNLTKVMSMEQCRNEGQGKREIPENIRRPAASSARFPEAKIRGRLSWQLNSGSPRWEGVVPAECTQLTISLANLNTLVPHSLALLKPLRHHFQHRLHLLCPNPRPGK
ncbi:hypothetical protein PR048_010406 [Dryococelus australis]|uniref:Uncharacterized protein n=1 Tax=Dryococelus australis TaxID=614101 RepID=A0ABQ9I2L9_9NEOP|nr:hypothetical protein PR048_010406 [Dryococelus australis]